MRKKTNFDIVNYVHLSYAGALEDNGLRGGGSKTTLEAKLKRNSENIEAQFKSAVGMSSKDFLKSAEKYGDLLTTFIEIFNSDTIKKIKELSSEEAQLKLEEGEEAAMKLRMIQAAKVSGYSNILGQLLTKKDEEGIESYINSILKSFSGINLYEEFLKGMSSEGGQSLDSKKRAMSLSLIKLIFDNAVTLKEDSSDDTLFSGTFQWQEPSYDAINAKLEKISSSMQKGIPIRPSEIDEIIKDCRSIINTKIKGATVGEYSSGIIGKKIISPILEKVHGKINEEILHTGTKSRAENEINIPIAQLSIKKNIINLKDPKNAVAKGIQNFITKDKKADITIKYDNKNSERKSVTISTKRYGTAAKFINIADNISIGKALAFMSLEGTSSSDYFGNGRRGAQFYNALNFYLLKSDFNKKDGKISEVFKESSPGWSITAIDAAFGGILTKFLLDVLANNIKPESSAFMDINGEIIPTPIYYKYMMKRLLSDQVKNNVSSFIEFNRGAYIKNTESKILDSNITGALKKPKQINGQWRSGYRYDMAALKRNLIVKQNILTHQITIKGNLISLADYKQNFLKI